VKGSTDDHLKLTNFTSFRNQLFELLEMINVNYLPIMKDEKSLGHFIGNIFKDMEKLVSKIKPVDQKNFKPTFSDKLPSELGKMATSLYKLTLGDMSDLRELIMFTIKDKDRANSITEYIQESIKMIDIDTWKKKSLSISKNTNNEATDYQRELMKHIQSEQFSAADLFKLIDQLGCENGSVSFDEFKIMAQRIGTPLTKHRMVELFTDIKSQSAVVDNDKLLGLDQEEFVKALDQLKRTQIWHALDILGVTPEVLYSYFVYLLFLLLLLFSFIFLGIKAFAIGGASNAFINSALPMLGAASVGGKDDNKDQLAPEIVKAACKTSMSSLSSKHE